ncbi:MAG: trypsin-like serine protease [Asgard group archaeon]|nr:trypsin-like serine protease [Asgard group archaeon]
MYVTKKIKKKNYSIFMLISIVIVVAFIIGFIFGGSFIYGLSSQEIDNLQYQVDLLNLDDNTIEFYNNSYYYNETSLSDIYNEVKESVVVISGIVSYQIFWQTHYYEIQGSGFIYKFEDEYYVITNNHVVSDVSELVITFSNGDSYPGEIIGSDSYSDLAVLSVEAPTEKLKPLNIISSTDLQVGDPVIAIGSPMGLDNTMTIGIVSQVGRTIEGSNIGSYLIANVIQTSVAINPGNSGGPLLDYQGNVVGITTAIVEDSEGLGFAIPSNTILKEIESLVNTGLYNSHPWLGISGIDMSYSIAQVMNVDVTYGWLIGMVVSGGSAENAGLQGGNEQVKLNEEWVIIGGDLIIAIDGNRIINGDILLSYIEEYTQPGDEIIITILRENEQIELPLTVGIRS